MNTPSKMFADTAAIGVLAVLPRLRSRDASGLLENLEKKIGADKGRVNA
ncbi:MAG: hypothetical protein ACRDAX_08685 [Propionibacteriaceae bacterium]